MQFIYIIFCWTLDSIKWGRERTEADAEGANEPVTAFWMREQACWEPKKAGRTHLKCILS
jgi:hypothetical protein